MPEGEEKEQEIENLFGKNNERKLPLFGEGNRHASLESTESQPRWMQRGPFQDTS